MFTARDWRSPHKMDKRNDNERDNNHNKDNNTNN